MAVNWQEVIVSVFTTVGGGAVFLGIAAWLLKTVISDRLKANADAEIARVRDELTRESEAFTIRLKADTDKETVHLTSSLQQIALEHQVRFSKLHEKRAEVIAQIYEKLVEAENEVKRLVYQLGRREPNKPMPAEEKLNELFAFVDIHRIYLPEQICSLLGDFRIVLIEPLAHAVAFGDIQSYDPTFLTQKHEGFKQSRDAFQSKIPAVRKALEQEFRLLLGDKP